MNLDELEKKLLAAAKRQPQDDRVPYAFEKRIMAHIASRGAVDRWVVWGNSLWRAAASCVAIAVVCGGIALYSSPAPDNNTDLSQDFENTLLASADQPSDLVP
jgi:hypothetical protein